MEWCENEFDRWNIIQLNFEPVVWNAENNPNLSYGRIRNLRKELRKVRAYEGHADMIYQAAKRAYERNTHFTK